MKEGWNEGEKGERGRGRGRGWVEGRRGEGWRINRWSEERRDVQVEGWRDGG